MTSAREGSTGHGTLEREESYRGEEKIFRRSPAAERLSGDVALGVSARDWDRGARVGEPGIATRGNGKIASEPRGELAPASFAPCLESLQCTRCGDAAERQPGLGAERELIPTLGQAAWRECDVARLENRAVQVGRAE